LVTTLAQGILAVGGLADLAEAELLQARADQRPHGQLIVDDKARGGRRRRACEILQTRVSADRGDAAQKSRMAGRRRWSGSWRSTAPISKAARGMP
jgi:hypothetical protein